MADSYTPKQITVPEIIALRNQCTKPIDMLDIPNIFVPSHMVCKKRSTQASDTIAIHIRVLFNSLTSDNIDSIKVQLISTVVERVKSVELIDEVATEILSNFIISSINIDNYMHLLNAICSACVELPSTEEKKVSKTIGNYFLDKCKNKIFQFIKEDNIRRIAMFDHDDPDQFDLYNKERERINNMIITICALYSQRNTNLVRLTAVQLYHLIKIIMNTYFKYHKKMLELGDPYEGECADEEEYFIVSQMATLYAEQLYTFMFHQAKHFNQDPTTINEQRMIQLVDEFRNKLVPTLTEHFLISNCKNIEYE